MIEARRGDRQSGRLRTRHSKGTKWSDVAERYNVAIEDALENFDGVNDIIVNPDTKRRLTGAALTGARVRVQCNMRPWWQTCFATATLAAVCSYTTWP